MGVTIATVVRRRVIGRIIVGILIPPAGAEIEIVAITSSITTIAIGGGITVVARMAIVAGLAVIPAITPPNHL